MSVGQRGPDGVQAGDEFALSAEGLDHPGTDARHNMHVADNVGAVGDLHANLRYRGTDRSHGKGDNVHRATDHALLVKAFHRPLEFSGIDPIICRTRFLFSRGSNIGALFGPGHIAGIGAKQVAVRTLLERDGHTARDHLAHQAIVFPLAPVTPMNDIRLAQARHFAHPAIELFVFHSISHGSFPLKN